MSNRGAAIALCSVLLAGWLALPTFGAENETPKPVAPAVAKAGLLAYIAVAGAPGDGEQALSSRQAVRIDWTIFGPDGATLGGVSQTKFVRKGSLDKRWGAAADAAARAAANEIAKLLSPVPSTAPKAP